MDKIRINKYLSMSGICSRREADRLLERGKIIVNGRPAVMGEQVDDEDEIVVDGVLVQREEKEIILAYHKPAGIVCTTSKKDKDNIVDAIGYKERIYPVGRLDKDSTGLILLTNNGELMDAILRGRNHHEKEYVVTVDKKIGKEVLDAMEQGVPILDTMTRPCVIKNGRDKEFHIILTQGLNRQIRRMCEYFGYRVRTLKRIRVMNITLDDLPEGNWRELTDSEVKELKRQCNLAK